jgi:putrescine transport system ATP-binding protein
MVVMASSAVSGEGFLKTGQLVKRFDGVLAVDNVSLSINKGEIFALLGSSGCGKSTLLRMLAGFEKPSSGQVTLNGVDIASFPPYERPINMMFQSYALFPHLSVWENIAFGLKREGMPRAQIQARVDEMLQLVQLTDFAKRKPHQLSGGQQQRVALARSLAKKPQLLLLDEPLGALDKKLRERTQFELVNIIESVGVTCVMVTHDQEEAMTMASRIAVMSQGRVLHVGTPKEIYEYPNCRFVADFIGNINLFEGRLSVDEVDRCEVTTPQGVVKVGHGISGTLGMPLAVAVRPEKIRISKTKPDVSGNLFSGRVREIAYFGSYSTFIVVMDDGRDVKITGTNTTRGDSSQAAHSHDITWDDRVFFWWDDAAPVALAQ